MHSLSQILHPTALSELFRIDKLDRQNERDILFPSYLNSISFSIHFEFIEHTVVPDLFPAFAIYSSSVCIDDTSLCSFNSNLLLLSSDF